MNCSHRDHLAQIFSLALCAVAGLFAESAPPLLKVAASDLPGPGGSGSTI